MTENAVLGPQQKNYGKECSWAWILQRYSICTLICVFIFVTDLSIVNVWELCACYFFSLNFLNIVQIMLIWLLADVLDSTGVRLSVSLPSLSSIKVKTWIVLFELLVIDKLIAWKQTFYLRNEKLGLLVIWSCVFCTIHLLREWDLIHTLRAVGLKAFYLVVYFPSIPLCGFGLVLFLFLFFCWCCCLHTHTPTHI